MLYKQTSRSIVTIVWVDVMMADQRMAEGHQLGSQRRQVTYIIEKELLVYEVICIISPKQYTNNNTTGFLQRNKQIGSTKHLNEAVVLVDADDLFKERKYIKAFKHVASSGDKSDSELDIRDERPATDDNLMCSEEHLKDSNIRKQHCLLIVWI